MCKAKTLFNVFKCIAIGVNVVMFLAALCLIGGGSYAYAKVDAAKILSDQFEEHIPPFEDFVPPSYKKGLIGVLALSCCSRLICCIILFLVLLVVFFIPLFIITILSFQEKYLQEMLFTRIDDFALSQNPADRFLMAAVQNSLKCCGVRGPVDYFCGGVYDYACNPGCLTDEKVWKGMQSSHFPPVCLRTRKMVELCKKILSAKQCGGINIPKPINASGHPICLDYPDNFDVDGHALEKVSFKDYDPAKKNKNVHGSCYYNLKGNYINYKVVLDYPGCGYELWTNPNIAVSARLEIINICLLVITLFVAFEIALVIATWIFAKKEETRRSEEYSAMYTKTYSSYRT